MKIIVEGVSIELTPAQIATIEKERKRREKCRGSFKRMLAKLGFRQSHDVPGSFSHKTNDWYAEIIDRRHYSDVWMVGDGLKNSTGFPGGWVYESPMELEKEVVKALST
jgi:hypothetical protein